MLVLGNLQKITHIIFSILFGLDSFSHQSCATGTLLHPKEIRTQKSLPNPRQLIICRLHKTNLKQFILIMFLGFPKVDLSHDISKGFGHIERNGSGRDRLLPIGFFSSLLRPQILRIERMARLLNAVLSQAVRCYAGAPEERCANHSRRA